MIWGAMLYYTTLYYTTLTILYYTRLYYTSTTPLPPPQGGNSMYHDLVGGDHRPWAIYTQLICQRNGTFSFSSFPWCWATTVFTNPHQKINPDLGPTSDKDHSTWHRVQRVAWSKPQPWCGSLMGLKGNIWSHGSVEQLAGRLFALNP